jgi:hypothetical protein
MTVGRKFTTKFLPKMEAFSENFVSETKNNTLEIF